MNKIGKKKNKKTKIENQGLMGAENFTFNIISTKDSRKASTVGFDWSSVDQVWKN